jgi:hypothetical protein
LNIVATVLTPSSASFADMDVDSSLKHTPLLSVERAIVISETKVTVSVVVDECALIKVREEKTYCST